MMTNPWIWTLLTRMVVGVFLLVVCIYLAFVIGLVVVEKFGSFKKSSLRSIQHASQALHQITLLDRGVDSYFYRMELIRRAQKTIELEFFIFDLDSTSRLLVAELIKKAKEGVRVRLLVDSALPVFKMTPVYAKLLKNQGIEVRYYNTAPMYRFISSQHRSHRKLLIADDEVFITGGRNIADEYFDLDPKYNFIDSDIMVRGEIAKVARESSDQYYQSELTEKPRFDGAEKEVTRETKKFFQDLEADQKKWQALLPHVDRNLRHHECREVEFVTDPPVGGEESRKVFDSIVEMAKKASRELFVESPYFVIRDGGYDVMKSLSERGLHLHVLTNNLHSTDATYVIGSLIYKLRSFTKLNISISLMNGAPVEKESTVSLVPEARWGLHSKRAVIDGLHTLVGTYNIDPRSANLNSELIVVCKNQPELAASVLESFRRREKHAERLLEHGKLKNWRAITKNSSWGEKALLIICMPIANAFDFLL